MRMVRRITRAAAMGALPFALWAAIPAVQWCPLRWEQIPLETFVGCAASGGPGPTCRTRTAGGCEAAPNACPRRACEDDARSSAPSSCAAAATAMPAACPFAATVPRDPDSDQANHGRAYCLDGLNGGTALRAASPRLDPAPAIAAIAASSLEAERPAPRVAKFAPVAWARPPTEAWRRLPPARAPPAVG